MYHFVCPAKYRRVVIDEKVDQVIKETCQFLSHRIPVPWMRKSVSEEIDREWRRGMKRILIVDDEKEIRGLLAETFAMEGYATDQAADGESALLLIEKQPDLILLDINLPDMDGYQICQAVRGRTNAPILFLSARTEEADRIMGWKVGGDDYIMKPFGMEELLARIEAHFRRQERTGRTLVTEENLTVDFSGRRFLVDGRDVGLTKTEYAIAELLYTNKGVVLDRERIYENVRGYEGEADASIITEHIRRIRKKLGNAREKEYIETVWGVGYRWIG